MMRKNNNNKNYSKNRSGGGGGQGGGRRHYSQGGGQGGGNRGGNDSGNIARQKHHATQMREKYSNMARDAQNNGDRVDVEYYLQHVDHYTRVLTDIAVIEAERYAHQREQQIVPGGPNDPNAQEHHAQQPSGDNSGNNDAPASDSNGDQSSGDAPVEQSNQPRMTRQPRRQYNAPDNGAKEANSNTTEIPLPDSILPPI